MKSKRNNNINVISKNKNKTVKNKTYYIPSLKILKKGYHLYASKQYEGSAILEYNKSEELKYNDKCLMQNSSWFGDLNVAKSYKTNDSNIYRWITKKITNLLNINIKNEEYINNIFKNTTIELIPTISLNKELLNKIKYENPYLLMNTNEKALYEFKFCFGFITVNEQYEFMKFLKYLIENKFIDIKRRDGKSILSKLNLKISYYQVASLFGKKEKLNRISFYDFDKHAIMNLCKIVNNTNHKISGVYQKNDSSFWFPNLVVYKMDIQEYILFNPQDNLKYDNLFIYK
jgi:hypothetical protein